MPKFNIVGHFPLWYDWVMFLTSATLFTIVLVVGVADSRRCRKEWSEECQWFQGILYPKAMALALAINVLVFWTGHERGGLAYVGTLMILFATSAAAFIGFISMRFCIRPAK